MKNPFKKRKFDFKKYLKFIKENPNLKPKYLSLINQKPLYEEVNDDKVKKKDKQFHQRLIDIKTYAEKEPYKTHLRDVKTEKEIRKRLDERWNAIERLDITDKKLYNIQLKYNAGKLSQDEYNFIMKTSIENIVDNWEAEKAIKNLINMYSTIDLPREK